MSKSEAVHWHHLYRFGVRSGVRSLFAGELDLGLRAVFNPVRSGFVRYVEIPYVINALAPRPHDFILDVASPKHASLYVGSACGSQVEAIDIVPDFVDPYRAYARGVGATGVAWKAMDGTRLEHADESFDKAFSISALEHFIEEGDVAAVREIARVLKPGGKCAITVPFGKEARDVFKTGDVYDRRFSGEPLFFQRIYDESSLRQRLIEPAGWLETDRLFFRSRWGIEEAWEKLPRALQMALHWAGPLLAAASHYRVDRMTDERATGICCLTLRKSG